MKVKVVLITENNSPVSALGPDPEAKVKKGWDYLLSLVASDSENGDRGHVESVEILEG